jgi:hypothetical protein
MIFRALFWIGLVSLLAPHEPDFGQGHPGAGTFQPTPALIQTAAAGRTRTGQDCGSTCAGSLGPFTSLHLNNALISGLADVKAQIEADRRARRLGTKAT